MNRAILTCVGCGNTVEEMCGGEMCRDCHVSITWDECIDNTWADELHRQYGLPTPNERAARVAPMGAKGTKL